MRTGLERMRERIERTCERRGISYPWWIPAASSSASVLITLLAVAQRGMPPTGAVLVGGLLALAPLVLILIAGRMLPMWLQAAAIAIAVALLLTDPASPDFAPLLLAVLAAEVGATSRPLHSVVVALGAIAMLVVEVQVNQLDGAALYVVGVVLGLDAGVALRWQMRALTAERANTDIARQQAVLAERQHLAREVHDVVSHSLGIALLHVTGARHALQQHADIPDAIEALTEAERVGRAAMGDLRRTVGILSTGPAGTQPLPGIGELAELVEHSRFAGLRVDYECTAATDGVGAAAGLGLYRIVQESLANVAKHAPHATTSVCLSPASDGIRLRVRNTLPPGSVQIADGGRGLPGMKARAQQMGARLHCGVDGDGWLVEVTVPVGATATGALR